MKLSDFACSGKCPTCNGTGAGVDPRDVGNWIRDLRQRSNKSLREVAAKANLSPTYLSDLELGRRGWTEERFNRIVTAIDSGGRR